MLVANYAKSRRFHDLWALLLFFISISAAATLFIMKIKNNQDLQLQLSTISLNLSKFGKLAAIFIAPSFIYFCLVGLLYLFPKFIMHIAPFAQLIAIGTIGTFIEGLNALPLLIAGNLFSICFSCFFYFYYIRKNVKYAAPIVKKAIEIVTAQAIVLLPTIGVLMIISCILILFCIAAHIVAKEVPVLIFFMFNFFWAFSFSNYFIYVMVASIVCFNMKSSIGIYTMALLNTLYATGTIAFGSLISAIIKTLKYLNDYTNNRRREDGRNSLFYDFLYLITDLILRVCGELLEYMNKWVYVYISFNGSDYITSMKKAFNSFSNNKYLSLINDFCFSYVLMLINIIMWFVIIVIFYHDKTKLVVALLGGLSTIYFSFALDAAQKTLLVLFAEDTEEFDKVYEFEGKILREQAEKMQ